MANLNKVMLIGRLTNDPEVRTFENGGKVANFRFAVNNPKKNQESGQWEEEPVFMDVKAFNRERGKQLADLVERFFQKGKQFFIEGRLKYEQWTTDDGQKRSKLLVLMDNFEFFEPKGQSDGGYGGQPSYSTEPTPSQSLAAPEPEFKPPAAEGDGDIPF